MASRTGIPPLSRSPIARAIGEVLDLAFAVGQRLRHPRPIHSRGVVLSGEMRWIPDAVPAGLAFVDDAPIGPVPVFARVSRSLGLPAPLPDIIGLALRFDTAAWAGPAGAPELSVGDDPHAGAHSSSAGTPDLTARHSTEAEAPFTDTRDHAFPARPATEAGASPGRADAPGGTRSGLADIELASTGWGVPARFGLLPHRRVERARLGTLLPYRGRRGAVLLIARTRSGRPAATDARELRGADDIAWVLTLGHATAFGPWHPFAVLELRTDADQDDSGLRFDAVRHAVPGSRSYAWVRAARQPSYLRVQADSPSPRRPSRTPQPAPTGT